MKINMMILKSNWNNCTMQTRNSFENIGIKLFRITIFRPHSDYLGASKMCIVIHFNFIKVHSIYIS